MAGFFKIEFSKFRLNENEVFLGTKAESEWAVINRDHIIRAEPVERKNDEDDSCVIIMSDGSAFWCLFSATLLMKAISTPAPGVLIIGAEGIYGFGENFELAGEVNNDHPNHG